MRNTKSACSRLVDCSKIIPLNIRLAMAIFLRFPFTVLDYPKNCSPLRKQKRIACRLMKSKPWGLCGCSWNHVQMLSDTITHGSRTIFYIWWWSTAKTAYRSWLIAIEVHASLLMSRLLRNTWNSRFWHCNLYTNMASFIWILSQRTCF